MEAAPAPTLRRPRHSRSIGSARASRRSTREVHGTPVAYLDSGASSQRVLASIQAVDRYERRHHSNVHRGSHTLSAEATAAYEGARATVADHIGAADRREVIFVRNATEAINLVARAWGDANIGAGDRIVLTEMEHHSNIVPWQQLAERVRGRDRLGPGRRRRASSTSTVLAELLAARPEARRGRARLERARDREPARRDLAAGPRRGRARARRRRPGGAEARARRRRARRRLLRAHRPQGLRADRDRRAVGAARPAARDAAVPRRRLDDPQGDEGADDLGRPAGPLRGRHPGDRAGDRPRRRASLARRARHGRGHRARARDRRLRPRAARRDRRPADLRPAALAGAPRPGLVRARRHPRP